MKGFAARQAAGTVRWRRLVAVTAALATGSLAAGLVAPAAASATPTLASAAAGSTASAPTGSLGSLQAQAAALAQKITDEEDQVNELSEQYDGAVYHLSLIQAQVAAAKKRLATTTAHSSRVRSAVIDEGVAEYTDGGFNTPAALFVPKGDPVVAQSYFELATGNQSDTLDQLNQDEETLTLEQATLAASQSQAAEAVSAVTAQRQAVTDAQDQAQATLASVNGQIGTLVAQQQAAQEAAEQATYQAQQAQLPPTPAKQAPATKAPSSSASASGASGSSPATTRAPTVDPAPAAPAPTAPPTTAAPVVIPAAGSSAAAIAVRVALAQVGKPYQWGAEGPNSFDCSGLVTYAYAAAGVSLTHYTVAQWDETTHIPVADLAPGDLVFFYSDFSHVGIYLGGGMMVDAPHTGADVRVESIAYFGAIAGASRVN